MRNRLLLLALLLFISFSAFAQVHAEQGKVLLTNGQIVAGMVDHVYNNTLAIDVYDAANNKQTFELSAIDKITLDNGERFVAKEFKSASEAKTMIFQEIVVADNISLYKRVAPYLEFYVHKANEVTKLENNETSIMKENGKRYVKMDYKYIGTLTQLMQDRIDLTEKIQKTRFNEKSLADLVTAYNHGNVSYYFTSDVEVKRKPYFQAYAHYTNHATYYGVKTTGSLGLQAGAQYFFSHKSRHSIRMGLDYSNYQIDEAFYGNNHMETHSEFKLKTFSFKYQYDYYVQQDKLKLYLLVHLLDVGHLRSSFVDLANKPYSTTRTETINDLRFSPGTGIEFNATQKVSIFAEVNHLFQFRHLPKSVSLGLKYSFRKEVL